MLAEYLNCSVGFEGWLFWYTLQWWLWLNSRIISSDLKPWVPSNQFKSVFPLRPKCNLNFVTPKCFCWFYPCTKNLTPMGSKQGDPLYKHVNLVPPFGLILSSLSACFVTDSYFNHIHVAQKSVMLIISIIPLLFIPLFSKVFYNSNFKIFVTARKAYKGGFPFVSKFIVIMDVLF